MNNVGPTYENTVLCTSNRDTNLLGWSCSSSSWGRNEIHSSKHTYLRDQLTALSTQNSNLTQIAAEVLTGVQTWGQGCGRHSPIHVSNATSIGTSTFNSGPPMCQICGKQGHTAIDRYQRTNQTHEKRIFSQKLDAMQPLHRTPLALLNNASTTWVTDRGASNHITADLANLSIDHVYQGKAQAAIGNGADLKITWWFISYLS